MIKKVYGLLGFAGLVTTIGVVTTNSACSSDDANASSSGAPSDAGKETGSFSSSSSSSSSSSGGKEAGPNICPVDTVDPASLDTYYRPGTSPTPDACNTADIAAITGKTTIKDVVAALDTTQASCKACALTADGKAAAKWAPLVTTDLGSGTATTIPNWGACVGGKSSAACGELEQRFQLCYLQACAKCASADATACRTAAYDGADSACQKMASIVAKNGCDTKAYNTAHTACGNDIIKHITAHCGPGSADAGGGG